MYSMTRRYLIYKTSEGFLVSQEFNGDRDEAQAFHLSEKITLRWSDVISLFEGVPDSPLGFQDALKRTEDGFGYENLPPELMKAPPEGYELWVFTGRKLQLITESDVNLLDMDA